MTEPLADFIVPSFSDHAQTYTVRIFPNGKCTCTCPDWIFHATGRAEFDHQCKHIKQVIARFP